MQARLGGGSGMQARLGEIRIQTGWAEGGLCSGDVGGMLRGAVVRLVLRPRAGRRVITLGRVAEGAGGDWAA